MLSMLILAVFFTSIGSILLASLVLKLHKQLLDKIVKYINIFAGGMLLAAAFIGLIPKALSLAPPVNISVAVFVFISFFIIAGILVDAYYTTRKKSTDPIHKGITALLLGSAMHSFLDGIVIVTSFYISVSLGLAVALSVLIHEIPRQVSTIGILLGLNYSKRFAFVYNAAAGSAMIAGAILYFLFDKVIQVWLPYFFSFAAAGFIFVSLSVLLPGLLKEVSFKESVYRVVLYLLAIALIALAV